MPVIVLGWGATPTPWVKHKPKAIMYSQTPAPLYPGQVTVTVRCGHMTRWLSCWCGHRGCAVHLPRLAPENPCVTLSPFPIEALRGWWNMVEELVLLNPCVQGLVPNTGTGILLTLEYGFELCKSIYTWILSNKHIISPLYSWVLWIQSTADWKQYFLEMQKADYMHILCHFI